MLFNSSVFLQFFAAFLLLYFLCRRSLTARNVLIVAASWLFYGWWDYRFLFLLIFSGCFDFCAGLLLGRPRAPGRRRLILGLSLLVNLSLLGFFKYYGFFVDSLASLFAQLHVPFHTGTLKIVLPVGISFYTFQSLSYVIDIYRCQQQPARSLLRYLAYVSFFPQLVAGPIQRAHELLPQLERTLTITSAMVGEGLWLVLWGMFKKVAIADNLAPLVELSFDRTPAGGPAVIAGALAFAFQIYGDFSGYSDIARGLACGLGFELRENFRLPYFSLDLREFWRRWHISLSAWLRDYLYISMGGSRKGPGRTYVNLFATFLLGGLWHGAAWTFVLWGAWHGAGLGVTRWWQQRRGRFALPPWVAWPATFAFVVTGWVLFRARSLDQLGALGRALLDWSVPAWFGNYVLCLALTVAPLVAVEVWQRKRDDPLAPLAAPAWARGALQGVLVLGVLLFWEKKSVPFIYFQF